jgi:hypothetical protein
MVLVLALVVTGLIALGLKITRAGLRRTVALASPPVAMGGLLMLLGCGDPNAPEDIWLRTGAGPGQVVYPRCIDYSPKDDTFFVVDRLARVQHIDRNGHFLNVWQMPDWQNGKPTGVTIGPDGDVYLADTHYQRVMVYGPDGTFLR